MTFWDKFWTPDAEYLNAVNTTNLRSVTGIRVSVLLAVAGLLAFAWATGRALPYCGGGPCAASAMERESAAKFADSIFDSLLLFAAGLVGISVGGYIGKRTTDTGHKVAVEEAKKAPVVVTQERPAPPATIIARDQSTVNLETEADAVPASTPQAVSEAPPQEWASGDPRAGVL